MNPVVIVRTPTKLTNAHSKNLPHWQILQIAHTSSLRLHLGKIGVSSNYVLECTIPPYSLSSSACHNKSGSLLLILYFSNMANWTSPKLLTESLTMYDVPDF